MSWTTNNKLEEKLNKAEYALDTATNELKWRTAYLENKVNSIQKEVDRLREEEREERLREFLNLHKKNPAKQDTCKNLIACEVYITEKFKGVTSLQAKEIEQTPYKHTEGDVTFLLELLNDSYYGNLTPMIIISSTNEGTLTKLIGGQLDWSVYGAFRNSFKSLLNS